MSSADVQVILHRLSELDRKVGKVETKLEKHAETMNGRIRAIELWKARMEGLRAGYSWVPIGLAAALSSMISVALAKLLG